MLGHKLRVDSCGAAWWAWNSRGGVAEGDDHQGDGPLRPGVSRGSPDFPSCCRRWGQLLGARVPGRRRPCRWGGRGVCLTRVPDRLNDRRPPSSGESRPDRRPSHPDPRAKKSTGRSPESVHDRRVDDRALPGDTGVAGMVGGSSPQSMSIPAGWASAGEFSQQAGRRHGPFYPSAGPHQHQPRSSRRTARNPSQRACPRGSTCRSRRRGTDRPIRGIGWLLFRSS
jgi:hypothetical protein